MIFISSYVQPTHLSAGKFKSTCVTIPVYYNLHWNIIFILPTASPGQARDRMYFIQTKSSKAEDVTVLRERESEGDGEGEWEKRESR